MEVLGDVVEILLREIRKSRHSALGTPVPDRRSDFLALFVVENQHRANQVRALSAARALTVTGRAVLLVNGCALSCSRLVGGRSQAQKLPQVTAPAASATAGGGPGILRSALPTRGPVPPPRGDCGGPRTPSRKNPPASAPANCNRAPWA